MQLEKISSNKLVQMLKGQKCSFDKIGLEFDKFAASSSNIASTSKTIFVKPEISEPYVACLDKGKNVIGYENAKIESNIPIKKYSKTESMPTCHHYGIIGHIRPHCPQIHSQRPWTKKRDLKKGKSSTRLPMTHHAPRQKRQPSQRFVPTCHHYGKIGHDQSSCFKLKPREPKNNHIYEGLFNTMRDVLTRLDRLDNSHNTAPRDK
jgi:hypothetical protein